MLHRLDCHFFHHSEPVRPPNSTHINPLCYHVRKVTVEDHRKSQHSFKNRSQWPNLRKCCTWRGTACHWLNKNINSLTKPQKTCSSWVTSTSHSAPDTFSAQNLVNCNRLQSRSLGRPQIRSNKPWFCSQHKTTISWVCTAWSVTHCCHIDAYACCLYST